MVEIQLQLREQKTIKALSAMTEPVRASDLEELTGLAVMNIGISLRVLAKAGLAELMDKRKKLWRITDSGREIADTIKLPPVAPLVAPPVTPAATPPVAPPATSLVTPPETPPVQAPEPKEQVKTKPDGTTTIDTTGIPTVPTQIDLFRREGDLLGLTKEKKGQVPFDAVIEFVQRTADVYNLTSVWNALTKMGVANDIKKRWIELYSQDLPDHKIPDELKEKLESGQEEEKVSTEAKPGEVLPKPKRFSIVAGEIMGDPEGDYTFNEAFKIWAQQKGVPTDQVNPLAIALQAMVDSSKEGPQTLTAMLAAITPLVTRETPKHDDSSILQFITAQQTANQSQMQLMQQMLATAVEEKHKAELEGIKAMITTGQKPAETETLKDAFTKQIDALKETIHQQQLDNERKERERLAEQFQSQITELKQLVTATAQGKSVDSKIGLMDKGVDKIAGELAGVRQDFKGFATMMMAKGEPLPKPRSTQEKQGFKDGLTKGIEKAEEAKRQAQELWGNR